MKKQMRNFLLAACAIGVLGSGRYVMATGSQSTVRSLGSDTGRQSEESYEEDESRVRTLSRYLLPGNSAKSRTAFSERLQADAINRAVSSGQPVIVLDPGHGGSDAGCNRVYEGVTYKESVLCLQIAQSCQQFLEKVGKAKVFLTRSTDVYVNFNARTQLAFEKGAAILVSFHLNATGASETSATGSEAIYQNSNYNPTVAGWSKQLASIMVEHLSKLGLKNRGIYYKNSASAKYPDGTVGDNFAINRQCKELGIPGIIIEHCFLNNTSDFQRFLQTKEKTDLLAKADADGIAEYLGLGNKPEIIATPQTPTELAPSGMTEMRVKVRFSYPGTNKPGGYELYRSTTKDGSYAKVANGSANAKYMVDATGKPGEVYYYKVRAFVSGASGVVYGAFSDVVSYAVLAIPEWSGGREQGNGAVTLSWNAVSGASGYELKRATSMNGTFEAVGTSDTLSIVDGQANGKNYYYQVRAYRTLSDRIAYSKFSDVKMIGTTFTKAERIDADKILLQWKKKEGVSGYRLYRSENNGAFSFLKEFSKDETSFEDTGRDLEKNYQYRIRTFITEGSNKAESFDAECKVSGGVRSPKITKTAVLKNGTITICWEKNSQAAGYELYRLSSKDETLSTKKRVATISGDKTSYTDKTGKATQAYVYAIRAYKKEGSKFVYAKEPTFVFSGTYIRTVLPYSDTKIRVAWKKMSGATGYKFYVSEKKDSGYRLVKTCDAQTVSFIHSGRIAKKTYYYRVQAVCKELVSKSMDSVKGATVAAPVMNKPTSNKQGIATISWKAVKNAKGYQIFRSTKESSGFKRMLTTKKLTYVDAESAKRTYYYKVKAYFVEEGYYGYTGYSSVVTNAKNVLLKPKIPTLSEMVKSELDRKLSWTTISGVSGYKVYRSTTGQESDYTLIKTLSGASNTTYDDLTAKDAQVYYYRVRAYVKNNDKTVYSGYSNPVLMATVYGEVRQLDDGGVMISWQQVRDAACYQLYRQKVGDTKKENLGSLLDNSYEDRDVANGESYIYSLAVGDGSIYNTPYSLGRVDLLGTVKNFSAEGVENFSKVRLSFAACSNANGYELSRKSETDADYVVIAVLGEAETTYLDAQVEEGKNYQYRIRPLQTNQNVVQYGSYSEIQVLVSSLTPVMGRTQATKEQMVSYFKRVNKPFPVFYADPQYGGVTNIEEFVQIIIEEATVEGVRADLVAAQIFKETGYLQFGGDVKITQCNFAGLGAVGGGAQGASFPDVRTGIRAQVQHLKAYGDAEATLVYACVDSRFEYVTKGSAMYIEWLGIKENPKGKGWATAKNYGYDLVAMLKVMKQL